MPCLHLRTYYLDGETVECINCGIQWGDCEHDQGAEDLGDGTMVCDMCGETMPEYD